MKDLTYPGKNLPCELVFDKRLCDKMIEFIGDIQGPITDIGESNEKSSYIAEKLNCAINQLTCEDFNYPTFSGKYKTIFCFEILEHVQNPLLFIRSVSSCLEDGGVLYLTTPGRVKLMWPRYHFFEMTPKHLQKWICEPLGLFIVRSRKMPLRKIWTIWDFIGIRPLLRLPFKLFNGTNMYKIMWSSK
jgi:Methyltransferase domain